MRRNQCKRELLLVVGCLLSLCVYLAQATEDAVVNGNDAAPDFVKVFTVATERTDGFLRYMRSARVYDIELTPLGLGDEWKGGNMEEPGGGVKINMLRDAIKPFKNDQDKIILFTDSYDVIFTTTLKEIVNKFKETGAKILFSAEKFCWPDEKLAKQYPSVVDKASPYLNSGAFIGYAPQLYALIESPLADTDDDQLYYTKKFLDVELRKKLHMQLDTKSKIFQNLNGAKNDVKLDVNLDTNQGMIHNINFETQPSIIHGNGPSKIELNAYGNYLAKMFNGQCLFCQENRIELDENNLPVITMGLMVTDAVPFFDVFLRKILQLNYPKKKLHLIIYNSQYFHEEALEYFSMDAKEEYASVDFVSADVRAVEVHARNYVRDKAMRADSDYVFYVDADVHIDDPQLLRELLIANKQFVAPVVSKYEELWSNFWGSLSDQNYYARSYDYVDIIKGDIIGMWNVPHVSSIYLIKKSAFKYTKFSYQALDSDMALCHNFRLAGVFMYVTNMRIYGHIVNKFQFNTKKTRPDFYTLFTNQIDWTAKYIHPNYSAQLESNATILQPCTDVFWFQVVTDQFCDDLVEILETYGKWSDGTNTDSRLEGGYEAVPTRDIHMKQVGLDPMWLRFLKLFVRPLQEKVFNGYFHNPPVSSMNFVVRYRPDEQPSLRPHHDASTYTINLALNRVGIDYEGGGCRFLRYNCSVTETKKGWLLMHPGRLTHYHEGLLVTNGTRYIMISFVDP